MRRLSAWAPFAHRPSKRLDAFFAVLLGVAVLGERLSGDMVWGAILIVESFGLLVRAQWRGATPAAAGPDAAPEPTRATRDIGLTLPYG